MVREQAPAHWHADVVLADGGTVHLRPITPADAGGLVDMHSQLSERTLYLRFFGPYPKVPARDLERFTNVDHSDRVALVAVLGDDLVGVARYERLDGDSAEVAFVVRDDHQGRGLGSILLEHLAAAARERGIKRFVAEVLAENAQMLRVFRDAGYQGSRELDAGVLHLEFDIDPTERSVAVAMAREQAAEARSVHNLLHPRSVAVIGASAEPSKIGHTVLRNLLTAGFTGPVYPVNPQARSVCGVPAYRSIADVPGPVDLAVVAVPAASVAAVADGCLAKGVKALVVVSAGFGETGPAGRRAERELVSEARAHGMRVVGPNALGVVNTDPQIRLNASLAPVVPSRGRVGFFCQSGALGIAILAEAANRGLGLSAFVSAGNRADVSGNDLLQYWHSDAATDVVLLYLETFGNPRKFGRLVRRVAGRKPVVVVSSGRHVEFAGAGVRPQPLAELADASVRALFEQAGVIRVESLDQLFDTALLLAGQPLPAGPRVAVVGNSSALGVLVADAVLANGLRLAGAPVDVGAAAAPDEFAAAVRQALAADDVDAMVAVHVPPVSLPGADYALALQQATEGVAKPVVSTFVAADVGAAIPTYPSPERAVSALARAVRYAEWRRRPTGEFSTPDGFDGGRASSLVAGWLAGAPDGRALSDAEVIELLTAAGIHLVPLLRVSDVDGCVAAAEELGYPVVVKAVGERWRHRADLVGVRLDLLTPDAVRVAYLDIAGLSGSSEVYVQRMAPRGVSCAFGLADDPSFGTVLSFGLHGVLSELVGDRAYRALPLSTVDAAELILAPKAAPLLTGYRGAEQANLDALAELALRLSRLAEQVPAVRRLWMHPVLAAPEGAFVTAAMITVGSPPARPEAGPRRLR